MEFVTQDTSKMYGVTFDSSVFKVILLSFGAFILKWPVTRKWLSVELKGLKFGTRGIGVMSIWSTFDPLVFKVV